MVGLGSDTGKRGRVLKLCLTTVSSDACRARFIRICRHYGQLICRATCRVIRSDCLTRSILRRIFLRLTRGFAQICQRSGRGVTTCLMVYAGDHTVSVLQGQGNTTRSKSNAGYRGFTSSTPLPRSILVNTRITRQLVRLIRRLPLLCHRPLRLGTLNCKGTRVTSTLSLARDAIQRQVIEKQVVL